jgi:hypothetical protein
MGTSPSGSFIKQLAELIGNNQNIIASLRGSDSESKLLQLLCAFTIVEAVYDRCTVDDIKGSITRAYYGICS